MRSQRLPLIACCVLTVTGLTSVRAAEASSAPILPQLKRVADWQLSHPSNQPADGWVMGAFYAGLSALASTPGGESYQASCAAIGEANHWKLGARPYHADDMCVGMMYLESYRRDKNPKALEAMLERCDTLLAHPSTATLDFDAKKNPGRLDRWSWCDALFMAPPAWARLAAITGKREYLDAAVKGWWETTDFLYDRTEHLYARDSSYFTKREKNGQKIFWGRGNGWVIAGLARLLQYMPDDYPDRPRFVTLYRELALRLKEVQAPDGFWRSSLLDPKAYPAKESSGTGLICFGLAWGVDHGILDKATFQPSIDLAWAALSSCVEADGKFVHVQPIGAAPNTFDPESTVPYGVGAFLLAGTELIAGGRP